MAGKTQSSIVKISVRKHPVTIADELFVKIHHGKECRNPCSETENIVSYLQAEMFLY
jgi:hypothetical protein